MNIILGDIHVYEQHVEGVKEQIQRIPFAFPQLNFKSTYESIEAYTFEDIEVVGYQCHPVIKYQMIA
jgi:thymidylate synthase